ncbi:MAG TPA: zinc ribbon domain-containing protein [Verrucomicrobiae bacterium]|nr:zinc ribbon domain-containing protein [Verrucomicrobiae bacterium]
MALIQFTRNHTDHSTDRGYQFEFFCDRCGNGYMSEFQASVAGLAGSAIRTVGNLFGGFLGSAGSTSYEVERAVQGPAHDSAYRQAIEEAKPNFHQCPKCTKWVCLSTCWNGQRMLCYECAPDVATEMAAAQAQTTVDQMRQKVQQQDFTANLNVTAEAAALCPSCGARTQGAKFCPECGKPLRPKGECPRCGTNVEAGTKFCPECGNKMA